MLRHTGIIGTLIVGGKIEYKVGLTDKALNGCDIVTAVGVKGNINNAIGNLGEYNVIYVNCVTCAAGFGTKADIVNTLLGGYINYNTVREPGVAYSMYLNKIFIRKVYTCCILCARC